MSTSSTSSASSTSASNPVMDKFFSLAPKAIEYAVIHNIATVSRDQMFNSQFLIPFITIIITSYINPEMFQKFTDKIKNFFKTLFKLNNAEIAYVKEAHTAQIHTISNMKNYYDEYHSKFNISEYRKYILYFNVDFHTNLKLFLGDLPEITHCMNMYDMKNKEVKQDANSSYSLFDLFTAIAQQLNGKLFNGMLIPVYICANGNPVFLIITQKEATYYIKDLKDFDEFGDFIVKKYQQVSTKLEVNVINTLQIVHHGSENEKYDLYPNRSFDRLVSRHKPQILRALDCFVQSNTYGESVLNGFGTYNLGFLLYGLPGTGKTALIKAIALYLKRNVFIVDMRKIKTRKDFEKLFTDRKVSKWVYVFEEFDCVQNVIGKRSNDDVVESESVEVSNERKELLNQKKALQLQKLTVDKERMIEIDKQISNIDNEIAQLSEKMSLDAILTTLDGVAEFRSRVIIATTNHIDKIDSALTRAGRFDMKIELTAFVRDEIVELLQKMYRDNEDYALIESANFVNNKYTPIDIINVCLKHSSLKQVINILCSDGK